MSTARQKPSFPGNWENLAQRWRHIIPHAFHAAEGQRRVDAGGYLRQAVHRGTLPLSKRVVATKLSDVSMINTEKNGKAVLVTRYGAVVYMAQRS